MNRLKMINMGKKYWTFQTFKSGLETIFRDYQILSMKYLWGKKDKGAGSGEVWLNVNKSLKEKGKEISRASIIFFLNDMVDHDILEYVEESGKGGYHRIYAPVYDEMGFREHLAKMLISKLRRDFPEETKTAIWKLQRGKS